MCELFWIIWKSVLGGTESLLTKCTKKKKRAKPNESSLNWEREKKNREYFVCIYRFGLDRKLWKNNNKMLKKEKYKHAHIHKYIYTLLI